jgi:hypothetical protein
VRKQDLEKEMNKCQKCFVLNCNHFVDLSKESRYQDQSDGWIDSSVIF